MSRQREFPPRIIARLTKREGRAKAKMNRWRAQTDKDSHRLLYFFSMNNSNCSDDTHSENRQHHDEGYFFIKVHYRHWQKNRGYTWFIKLLGCSKLPRFSKGALGVLARVPFFTRNRVIIPCDFMKKFVWQKGLS